MAKKAALISLIAIMAVATVVVGVCADDKQKEFDFWMLAMRWAPSICLRTTSCCYNNACCRSNAPNKFVIQGLWPDYNDLSYPTFCDCDTKRFNLTEIVPLIPKLDEDWPSLSCNRAQICSGTTQVELEYQWEKHGTCGNLDQPSYFLKAIQLYDQFNAKEIFAKAGITPSNNQLYGVSDIAKAIQNSVGASALVVCENGYLKGVRLCFSKDSGQPQDCPNTVNYCPNYVKIPVYGPIALNADL